MKAFYTVLHGHPTGQVFRVMQSSQPGLLNVSVSTGGHIFLGYAEDVVEASAIIVRCFGPWERKGK